MNYLGFDGALLVAVTIEGVGVRLGRLAGALRDRDTLPPELLDGDEGLVEMRILGHKVRSQMKSKAFRDEDMRRCLR